MPGTEGPGGPGIPGAGMPGLIQDQVQDAGDPGQVDQVRLKDQAWGHQCQDQDQIA